MIFCSYRNDKPTDLKLVPLYSPWSPGHNITGNDGRNLNNQENRHVMLPGLNRERLIEELLVEILLDVMDEDDRFALVVKLRPTCSPHHLQNIYTYSTNIMFHYSLN